MTKAGSIQLDLDEKQRLLCESIQCENSNLAATAAEKLIAVLGDAEAFKFAQRNGVASIVGHHASSGRSRGSNWQTEHEATDARISEYLEELDRIGDSLAAGGISVVALKNAGIARGLHRCAGCNPMGDLDLLISKRDFLNAHEVLLELGYKFCFRSEIEDEDLEEAIRGGSTEYLTVLPSGRQLWVELQWRPVAGRWIRPDQEPCGDDLIERSQSIEGSQVRMLCPEDNLLQVSLHTAKHSYVRAPGFRLHTDVDRVVYYEEIDWHALLEMAQALQVRTPVYCSLALARSLLGTTVPAEVLAELQPPGWKQRLIGRWLRLVGVFDPDEPKFSQLGFILFTATQYDTLGGLTRAVFPSERDMRARYGTTQGLSRLYVRRLADLVFRRART